MPHCDSRSAPAAIKYRRLKEKEAQPLLCFFVFHFLEKFFLHGLRRLGNRALGLSAKFVDLLFISRIVRQASRPADTAANAGHTLDKIVLQAAFGSSEQRLMALLDSIACDGIDMEIRSALLADRLPHRVRHATAPCKNPAVVRGVIQFFLGQLCRVDISTIDERLQFFKRQHTVHIGPDALLAHFQLFRRAWPDKHNLGLWIRLFDALRDGGHRGKVMRDMLQQLWEILAHICDERRAAGSRQKALFHELPALCHGHHIRAERRLHNLIKAQSLDSADHLPQLRIGKLAGNGGRHHRIQLILRIILAAANQVDHLEQIGFIHNRAKRALIDAGAAGDALAVIDMGKLLFILSNRPNFAGRFARAFAVGNGAIGADARAFSAVDAFFFIDMRLLVLIKGDRAHGADVFTAVRNAAAAGIRHFIAAHRAFIAGNIQNFYDVRVFLISPKRHSDALADDRPLLIDATAHRRLFARDDLRRDFQHRPIQLIFKGIPRHFPQHFVFQMLNFGIKFSGFQRNTSSLFPSVNIYRYYFIKFLRKREEPCAWNFSFLSLVWEISATILTRSIV